jgi:hypothetical protein
MALTTLRTAVLSGGATGGPGGAGAPITRRVAHPWPTLFAKICSSVQYVQWRIQGDAGMHPPHQLDTIIYAGIYWRTGATVVVSV